MNPAETKRIYEQACRARRIVPQEDEGRNWHRVLREYDAREVQAALDAWTADTTPDRNGEPRGKWLPSPAELKPVVERVVAQRLARDQEPKDWLEMQCSQCHAWFSAAVPRGDRRVRKCRCGGVLKEQTRWAA